MALFMTDRMTEEKAREAMAKEVCSIELAKRLKQLGVKQESIFLWIYDGLSGTKYIILSDVFRESKELHDLRIEIFSAFSMAEMGALLEAERKRAEGLVATLAAVLSIVKRIWRFDPHPTHCDPIHEGAREIVEMINSTLSQYSDTKGEVGK